MSFNLIDQLMPILLSDVGGLNVEQIGFVNAARGVAIILSAPLGGWLVDKYSEKATIALGFALASTALVALVIAHSFIGFILAMLIFGLGTGALMPGYESLISKVVPENKRGLAFGLFGTTLGILSLPFPWIGAQLWERISPQTPFLFVVVACLISVPIVWWKFGITKEEREIIG